MSGLPEYAGKKLKPYIDKGVREGLWEDDSAVADMFTKKALELKSTLDEMGGIDSEIGQAFIVDAVTIDLSAILRQKKYTAQVEIWEVTHATVGQASGNPREACWIYGQTVVQAGDDEMDPALFQLSLWGSDVSIADDIERDGTYSLICSCRDLNKDVLDLQPLVGMSKFNPSEHKHAPRVQLMKDTFEVSDIADLSDDISRGRLDFRLIEATISYAGVQNTRKGGQMGKMLLKDESTTTLEAIESGENLLLSTITSTDIASRYGKYSKVLALATVRNDAQYGLSADVKCCEAITLVAPPVPETAVSGDDSADNAENYFAETVTDGKSDKKGEDWQEWE